MQPNSVLHSILEGLPYGVAAYDADERLIFVNHEFMQDSPNLAGIMVLGRSYEEIITLRESSGHRESEMGPHRPTVADRLQQFRDPNGQQYTRRYGARVVRIEINKMPDGITILTRHDITSVVALESGLLDLENRFASIFEKSNFGILVHRERKPIFVNSALVRNYGYDSIEEVLALKSTKLLRHPDYHADVHYRALEMGRPAIALFGAELDERETVALRKDGSTFWELRRSFVMDWEGAPAICSIRMDISDRKKTEDALLIAKHEAEHASAAKSEFMSTMSHELRTPLNAILGFSELLRTDAKEPLSGTQKKAVDHVNRAGTHLLNLIDQVLDLSMIDAGNMEMSSENTRAAEVLNEVVTLVENLRSAEDLKFVRRYEHLRHECLIVDRMRLRQVLLNLLSNAVKYNRVGGSVFVAADVTDKNRLRMSVQDSGHGIDPARHAEIFQPFNRLGHERSNIEGTGIGLVLAKKLAEEMGGEIGFESNMGAGSTFWVEFPLSETMPEGKMVVDQAPAETNTLTGKILYIEDNPANLSLMEAIIARLKGVGMLSAHTAELGLEMAMAEKPDLIIMDINLPGMSGLEAMRKIKDTAGIDQIPVIAISAHATKAHIDAGLSEGFVEYLTKPINVGQLIRSLENSLEASAAAE